MKKLITKVVTLSVTAMVSLTAPCCISADSSRPIPVNHPETITMCNDTYTLDSVTGFDTGIYTCENNPRNRDYIIQAINNAGVTGMQNDYEKVLAINKYLSKILTYDESVVDKPWTENMQSFTDFCVLGDKAVCAGYAEAFQSMCLSVGIECYYVTGYVKQGKEKVYHAWNQVILNGITYYIDPCWSDSSMDQYGLNATLWEDHEIDAIHTTYRISAQNYNYNYN